MGRRPNPRRHVLTVLAQFTRDIALLRKTWQTRSTVYVLGETPGTNGTWRPRESHEYPENDARYWLNLAHHARVLSAQAGVLSDYAQRQYDRLPRKADDV
jgi:hypothetical protein